MRVTIAIGKLDRYCQERVSAMVARFPQVAIRVLEPGDRDFSDTDVLLTRSLTTDELAHATQLSALFVPYTGLNRFPLEHLQHRGIRVINSHGKAAVVAERALALTLAVMGRVIEMHVSMEREGVWLTRKRWGEEYWYSLYNKRCGIYGMGHIAGELIKLLRPFNPKIVGLIRDEHKGLADVYVPDLKSLARECDILYVCVPLSEHTKGSINREVLSLMPGKFIVNIARGEVIDEEALYWALSQGVIAGAGIDVWYNYPEVGSYEPTYPSRYPVHELKNIVMSPHAASHAVEFKDGYYADTFDQLEYYLTNGTPRRQVDLGKNM